MNNENQIIWKDTDPRQMELTIFILNKKLWGLQPG